MEIVAILIPCLIVIAFCIYLFLMMKSERDNERLDKEDLNRYIYGLQQDKKNLQDDNVKLQAKLSEYKSENALLQEKVGNFQNELKLAREEMRGQFEKELEHRSAAFEKQNSEQMTRIVGPLQKELESLRTLVDSTKESQLKNTSDLQASIKAVFEHDKERDKTTQNLANALKNRGKVQGDWGEQVLEDILRDSGLRENEEYFKQFNVKDKYGANERPDVIVKGADGTKIIIDSKVSLTAYTDYVGAESDEQRTAAIKANYDSVWQHVVELSEQKYHQDVEKAMPIVLMFIPNEGSYILAMNRDPQLGTKAYKKGVLIINPTNLMVVLRLMFLTWQNTRQEKTNREILNTAGKLYDKYVSFTDSYLALGGQITSLQNLFDKGLGQLRDGKGNFSRQLENLRRYGISNTKELSEEVKPLDAEIGEPE